MSYLINDDDRPALLALISIFALMVLIRFWLFCLIVAGLTLIAWSLRRHWIQNEKRELIRLTTKADERQKNTVVSIDGVFHMVEMIRLDSTGTGQVIRLISKRLVSEWSQVRTAEEMTTLWKSGDDRPGHSVNQLLSRAAVQPLSSVAVETQAFKMALDCLAELSWCQLAREQIAAMIAAAEATQATAIGNPLLEDAIPKLERAIRSFAVEDQKLNQTEDSCSQMLRQLYDFLAVPEMLRPILSMNLNDWDPVGRLNQLETSFNEVVLLHDTLTELSRQGL